jgi:hypothetical protein
MRGTRKNLYIAVVLVTDYDVYLTLHLYRTKTRFKSDGSTYGGRKWVGCRPQGEARSGGAYGWWQWEGAGDGRIRRYGSTCIDPVQNDANRSYSFSPDPEQFYYDLFA